VSANPCPHCGSSSKLHPVDAKACARFGAEVMAPQSIEYLARIEYEAQVKCVDEGGEFLGTMLPWSTVSETHKEIARAGIRAVLEALGNAL